MLRLMLFPKMSLAVVLSRVDGPAGCEVKRFVSQLRLGVGPGSFPSDGLLE